MDTNGHTTVTPVVDIYEGPDDLLVVAELPGIGPDGVDVRVENETLHLTAKTAARSAGFARSFRLPPGVAGDHIDADLANGVLRIRLPKAESAKPRKITVKTH